MARGTVVFFNDDGYGVTETEASDGDVFFHAADVEGSAPEEGAEGEFDTGAGERGPRAANRQRV